MKFSSSAGLFIGIVALSVLLALSVQGSGLCMAKKVQEPPYHPGQVLVKFQDDVSDQRIREIVEGEKAEIEKILGSTGVYLILLPEGLGVPEAVERFNSYPEIQYAEFNYRVQRLER